MTGHTFAATVLGWHDFFLAAAGATAALLGLLFVGVSINLAAMAAGERFQNRLPTLRRIGWTVVADIVLAFTAWRIWDSRGAANVIGNLPIVVFVLLIGAADIAWEMLREASMATPG